MLTFPTAMSPVTVRTVSDLHLEYCETVPDLGTGDILVLAGDILCARHVRKKNSPLRDRYVQFLKRQSVNFGQIVYVMGNHEHYGYDVNRSADTIREILPANASLLDNDTVELGGMVFIGTTLWTDFNDRNPLEMFDAKMSMNDFSGSIRLSPVYRKLEPYHTADMFDEAVAYIDGSLKALGEDQSAWIVTHHAPSRGSIHARYRSWSPGSVPNSAYVSALETFILDRPQIAYWSHGHTHNGFRYAVGGCEVICNPYGGGDNRYFDPEHTITLT